MSFTDVTPSDGFQPNIIAVGGGKGGIGKSFLSAAISTTLARRGNRVLSVDLDLGGANLHAWYGTPALRSADLGAFLRRGGEDLDALLTPGPVEGLSMIHGASSNIAAPNLKYQQKVKLMSRLRRLPFDWIVLDLGAGSSYNTIDFFLLGTRGVLSLTPEKTSIENAYRFLRASVLRMLRSISHHRGYQNVLRDAELDFSGGPNLKKLVQQLGEADPEAVSLDRVLRTLRVGIVLNQVWDLDELAVAEHMRVAARRHLMLALRFYGPVRHDDVVPRALRRSRSPIIDVLASSTIADDIENVVDHVVRDADHSSTTLGQGG